jgi:outer membrane protein TolC
VKLLRRRPDVRAAEQRAAAESDKIGATKAEFYPAFSLSGTFGFLSSDSGGFDLTDLAQPSSRTANIDPAFKWMPTDTDDLVRLHRGRPAARARDRGRC